MSWTEIWQILIGLVIVIAASVFIAMVKVSKLPRLCKIFIFSVMFLLCIAGIAFSLLNTAGG